MVRRLMVLCVGVLVLLIHRPAEAALELSFEDVPTHYIPGVPFDFLVRLENAQDLNAFDFELALSAAMGGTPGPSGNFQFLGAAEPSERYVFEGEATGGFEATTAVAPGGQDHSIFMSDFLASPTAGVDTGPMNNLLARVTVQANDEVGNLTIAFAEDGAFFFDSNGNPMTVSSFAAPQNVAVIPEPSTLAICLLCGAGFTVYRLRNRRKRPEAA